MSAVHAAWSGTWAVANVIIFVWGLVPPRVPWGMSLVALFAALWCGWNCWEHVKALEDD